MGKMILPRELSGSPPADEVRYERKGVSREHYERFLQEAGPLDVRNYEKGAEEKDRLLWEYFPNVAARLKNKARAQRGRAFAGIVRTARQKTGR